MEVMALRAPWASLVLLQGAGVPKAVDAVERGSAVAARALFINCMFYSGCSPSLRVLRVSRFVSVKVVIPNSPVGSPCVI